MARVRRGRSQRQLQSKRADVPLWIEIKRAFEMIVARRPDSDFYRTFFNSVTRDLFGTVGVNPEVEFCATSVGRASGAVPIRVYRVGGSLPTAPCARSSPICPSARRSAMSKPPCIASARKSAATSRPAATAAHPESIELIEPVFYRGTQAFVVGRLIGDGAITPLGHGLHATRPKGVQVEAVMLSRADVGSLFGYARSYFHVDLPVVSAAITLLRSFMPRKSVDELYTVLGRAKQGKTERYFALQRHLEKSIDSFVHAPGERGLVMIVFTLPSHDLVFKVIRDQFGAPKTTTRADVIERYQFVFRHDRAGRLVDAQEFKRLRLPRARFMPALADELLSEASESCRIEGEDLIIEHCYIERRLRPLNLFLREAEPAAAESAIIDYGNALRDLAASNVFPGDLLLKNFGVTSHGRVIFYDYDEICLVSDCVFPRPAAAALRGGGIERRALVSLRAARRVPGTMAAVLVHSAGAQRRVHAAPCGSADGSMVARSGASAATGGELSPDPCNASGSRLPMAGADVSSIGKKRTSPGFLDPLR